MDKNLVLRLGLGLKHFISFLNLGNDSYLQYLGAMIIKHDSKFIKSYHFVRNVNILRHAAHALSDNLWYL